MFSISFYVPESHVDAVKDAMFAAGAGRLGAYSHCAWQVLGQGQFMPLEGSRAYLGSVGVPEYVNEYRVEMVCEARCLAQAIAALKAAHPYETPAYHVIKHEINTCQSQDILA